MGSSRRRRWLRRLGCLLGVGLGGWIALTGIALLGSDHTSGLRVDASRAIPLAPPADPATGVGPGTGGAEDAEAPPLFARSGQGAGDRRPSGSEAAATPGLRDLVASPATEPADTSDRDGTDERDQPPARR